MSPVLAAQSPVLKAMLDTPSSKEVNEGKVILEDFDSLTLKTFWRYLLFNRLGKAVASLTGKNETATNSYELVLNLLVLGDRYDMKGLKQECEKWLMDEMNPVNALRIIKVASLVQAKELTRYALTYVHTNRRDENLSPDKIISDDMPKDISIKLMEMCLNGS